MEPTLIVADLIVKQFVDNNQKVIHDFAYHTCINEQRDILYNHIKNELSDLNVPTKHFKSELQQLRIKDFYKKVIANEIKISRNDFKSLQISIEKDENKIALDEHEFLKKTINNEIAETTDIKKLNKLNEIQKLLNVANRLHENKQQQVNLKELEHEEKLKKMLKDYHVDKGKRISDHAQADVYSVTNILGTITTSVNNAASTITSYASTAGGSVFGIAASAWEGYVAFRERMLGQQYKTRFGVAVFNILAGIASIGLIAAEIAVGLAAAPLLIDAICILTAASFTYRDHYGARQEHQVVHEENQTLKTIGNEIINRYNFDKKSDSLELQLLLTQYKYHQSERDKHRELRFQYQASRAFNVGYTVGAGMLVAGLFMPPIAILAALLLATTAIAKFIDVKTNNKLSRWALNLSKKIQTFLFGENKEKNALINLNNMVNKIADDCAKKIEDNKAAEERVHVTLDPVESLQPLNSTKLSEISQEKSDNQTQRSYSKISTSSSDDSTPSTPEEKTILLPNEVMEQAPQYDPELLRLDTHQLPKHAIENNISTIKANLS